MGYDIYTDGANTFFNSFYEAYLSVYTPGAKIVSSLIGIFTIVCMWKVFEKAGKHGWAALIPIYNLWVLLEIGGFSGALSLLILIPVLGWLAIAILVIISYFKIAKFFGKETLFGIGLWLLNPIFMAILAFDDSTYTKEKTN